MKKMEIIDKLTFKRIGNCFFVTEPFVDEHEDVCIYIGHKNKKHFKIDLVDLYGYMHDVSKFAELLKPLFEEDIPIDDWLDLFYYVRDNIRELDAKGLLP